MTKSDMQAEAECCLMDGMKLYEVSTSGGMKGHYYAKTRDQAKRAFCRDRKISPSDYWCGINSLSTHALTKAEEKEYVEVTLPTYQFIGGMMDIYARAYQDKQGRSE